MIQIGQHKSVLISRQTSPMLAKRVARLPHGEQWAYEFKWDGIRALAFLAGGTIQLIGRSGSDLTARFPELHGLARLSDHTLVLDGEIIVMRDDTVDFGRIQPRIHLTHPQRIAAMSQRSPATYMIFDVLQHADRDLTDQSLRQRRKVLESLDLNGSHWAVPPASSGEVDGAAEAMMAVATAHGLEGVMAKRWDSTYESGHRSDAWVKYKLIQAQEFVIGGWRPSSSGSNEIGALAVGYHDAPKRNSPLRFAGFVGSGFSRSAHQQLFELLRRREQDANPFAEQLPRDDVCFTRPDLVAHVRFAQWTEQNILRHASYRGLREDKPAHQVVREL